jgi:glycosyltransferase involved in cell wall biosynthesis
LFVPYLRKKGYAVVTATDTFPGYNWWTASKPANAVLWLAARTAGKRVLRNSDHVILYHQGLAPIADDLSLPYSVIPNGVEFEFLDKAKPKKLAGKLNVLYVGRLESVKGYETIFAALQKVIANHPDVHFYHIGDDSGKTAFKQRYQSPNIHFEGRKDIREVYSYMKGADSIVLASRSEGLPNVIMEGMACGCVPISTPVGAVPALLENGKLGKLFPYNDVTALTTAVTWLLDHPTERKRMVAAGKQKIRTEYNWDTIGKQYYTLLSTTASR